MITQNEKTVTITLSKDSLITPKVIQYYVDVLGGVKEAKIAGHIGCDVLDYQKTQ